MVDPTMAAATFEGYKIMPHNKAMYECITQYARDFEILRGERSNSLGIMAVVGEMTIKAAGIEEQQRLLTQHNNFGLGKTHLQSALAIELLNRGVRVLMVNDADILAELREAQFTNEISNKMAEIMNAELLIWDDMGKSNYKEWAKNQVYQVINHRYRNGLPIVFSSNEDSETLCFKIGGATVSRLYHMCRGRWIEVEGPNYRL